MTKNTVSAENEARTCPDEGVCHHGCSLLEACFRVEACGPLSGVFPNNEWPEGVRRLEAERSQ